MFVTFRLHRSLPVNRVFPPAGLAGGQAFAAIDRMLDSAGSGPVYLKQPEIAAMVRQTILDRESPHVPLRDWLRSLRGFTSHEACRLLNLIDTAFRQQESYGHSVRNDEEFDRIRRYIAWNPVKAGLVTLPEQFLGSSSSPGGSPAAKRKV